MRRAAWGICITAVHRAAKICILLTATSRAWRIFVLRAADTFAEQGSFLRQEARAYNEKAEKAERLYEKLPTKFVLPEPDVYEGI